MNLRDVLPGTVFTALTAAEHAARLHAIGHTPAVAAATGTVRDPLSQPAPYRCGPAATGPGSHQNC